MGYCRLGGGELNGEVVPNNVCNLPVDKLRHDDLTDRHRLTIVRWFFPHHGSKRDIARHYPSPTGDVLIERFVALATSCRGA